MTEGETDSLCTWVVTLLVLMRFSHDVLSLQKANGKRPEPNSSRIFLIRMGWFTRGYGLEVMLRAVWLN